MDSIKKMIPINNAKVGGYLTTEDLLFPFTTQMIYREGNVAQAVSQKWFAQKVVVSFIVRKLLEKYSKYNTFLNRNLMKIVGIIMIEMAIQQTPMKAYFYKSNGEFNSIWWRNHLVGLLVGEVAPKKKLF